MTIPVKPGRSGSRFSSDPDRRDPEQLWSPKSGARAPWDSWRAHETLQQPKYPDDEALHDMTAVFRRQPPLVFAGEADDLHVWLGAAERGEAFVLTGGDCAEAFAEAIIDHLRLKIQTPLQMIVVLTYGASLPVVKIGQITGQCAKPHSKDLETRGGVALPSYRGDAVNSFEFTLEARVPDPGQLLEAYYHASSTLNLTRAFTKDGYADLRLVHHWNRDFTQNPAHSHYESLAEEIHRAVLFMQAADADLDSLREVDLYSSHEALLLEYRSAMTHIDSRTDLAYNASGYFLWVGERIRDPRGARIGLLCSVRNPIGVKLGPTITVEQILDLVEHLNPDGEEGRLTFITRMDVTKIREALPPFLEAAKADGRPVAWVIDPMHGNTITSSSGYKTRRFETIMDEVGSSFGSHNEVGTVPGSVHVELTGDDVTEVVGGSEELDEEELTKCYGTTVDPHLNHQQSLEVASQTTEYLRRGKVEGA